jgi:hypothetical protein
MNISKKLITLGLALSLLGSASALAKPSPYFENGDRWHEKSTVERHVPTARYSGRTGYARSPDKDGWPANMILD